MLPLHARNTTRWLFTDSPAVVEGCVDVFPALRAVAEDGLHLVIRVEACLGGHRTAFSHFLLRLQEKFRVPSRGCLYHGRDAVHDRVGVWNPDKSWNHHEARDWDAYAARPYRSHQSYIDDLLYTSIRYPDAMLRRNAEGRTVAQLLQAASAYRHFAYLRNGSVILGLVAQGERAYLGWGTTANEALHNEIRCALRVVTQQHEDSMRTKLQCFSLAKICAHNSAAYHGTSTQRRPAELVSLVHAGISRAFFPDMRRSQPIMTSRRDLRTSPLAWDSEKSAEKKRARVAQGEQWKKHAAALARKRKNGVRAHSLLSRRERVKKRTVFTKQRGPPLHRHHGQTTA